MLTCRACTKSNFGRYVRCNNFHHSNTISFKTLLRDIKNVFHVFLFVVVVFYAFYPYHYCYDSDPAPDSDMNTDLIWHELPLWRQI